MLNLSDSTLSSHLGTVLVVLRLAKGEWDVAVFNHMLDLSPHFENR